MRKYIYTAMLFLYAGNIARGQCECINGDIDASENIYLMNPTYPGGFINRNSNQYSLGFEVGKDYRVIMTPVAGNAICTNPSMSFENFGYGSNNYTADFTFTGNGYGFMLSWIFLPNVQAGQHEMWEFEIKKKIAGFYFRQSMWYLDITAVCSPFTNLTFPATSTVHGITKYEVSNYITASTTFANFYSDGVTNFDAGDYIAFNPGFSTGNTGSFEAYIDGCGGLRGSPAGDGTTAPGWQEAAPVTLNAGTDEDIGNVTVFPNPASDVLSVRRELPGKGSVRIEDQLGRIRSSQELVNQLDEIDISGLEPGMYLLHVSSGDRTKVIRFLKQ